MDAFPVAPELMQAFPVGALNLLVAVASAIAAQHGPENARRVSIELAANDDLWAYIASRLGSRVDPAGERNPDSAFEGRPPLAELEPHTPSTEVEPRAAGAELDPPAPALSADSADTPHIDEPEASASTVAADATLDVAKGEVAPEPPRRKRQRTRASTNGSPKANGAP